MQKKKLGQRILHSVFVKILIGSVIIVGIYVLAQSLINKALSFTSLTGEISELISAIVSSAFVLIAYNVLYSIYEKRTIDETSAKRIGQNLLKGFLLGVFLQAAVIFVIFLAGGYHIESVNSVLFLIPAFTMSVGAAVFEEILLRGIIFRIMEEKLGSYIALVISAFIFGFLHLMNPNSSVLVAIGLSIQAGILLGLAYMYTRNLWFPIAIHFGWNFTLSGIFGAVVSGTGLEKTLINAKVVGPIWITGGGFGPEGSVHATIICLIVSVILYLLCLKQNKIIAPSWSKSS